MKILHVVGSRSGFFRISPVFRALRAAGADHQVIVYAGHREDLVPRDTFLDELELPAPEHVLGVSSGTSATQTGRSLIALEAIVTRESPDWIFAVGDVDAALAAALVGRKNRVRLAHLEAGLRDGNGHEALEINRQLTDRLSDALFVAEREARANLIEEGIDPSRVHFVGNTAADTASRLREKAAELELPLVMGLDEGTYSVALLARADGLPGAAPLDDFLDALAAVAAETGRSTILALDPATAHSIKEQQLEPLLESMTVVQSPSYVELLALVEGAGVVITNARELLDSATVLGIPSIAIGDLTIGRSWIHQAGHHLSVEELGGLPEAVMEILADRRPLPTPELWDGRAAKRIADITMESLLASVA